MATYYASQAGTVGDDGLSVATAWSVATINWGLVDNDPANELYLLGAITSKVNVGALAGCIVRGDYSGQDCTIDVADAEDSCISISNKTFTASAPLVIKNLAVQGSDDSVNAYGDIFIFNSSYVTIDNVTGDGTTSDESGIQIRGASNITVQNSTFNNYTDLPTSTQRGIDVLPTVGSACDSITIQNNICNGNDNGIHLRALNSNDITNTTIDGNTCNNNGENGIALYAGANGANKNSTIENNTCDNNGALNWGTAIEISGADATVDVSLITIRYNTVSNTQDADSDGTDGVGIRFDDHVLNSVMYGNRSDDDITGFVVKNENNWCMGNIAVGSSSRGFRYAARVAGISSGPNYFIGNIADNCNQGFSCLDGAADNIFLYNNICMNNTGDGMRIHSGSVSTEKYNLFFNNTNNYRDTTDTPVALDSTDLTTDPLLTSNYKPTINSPAIAAGKIIFGARDYRGRSFHYPPNIGAYSSTSGDVAQVRTAREAW